MARGRFTFWLDYNKDEELLLADAIDDLKRKRRFVTTIRDGIRLICDLRQGRVEVLFELFPWVKSEWLASSQPQETAGERALKEQLARIEQQLIQQGNTLIRLPASDQASHQLTTGPKAMNVPKFNLPVLDDDDETDILISPSTARSNSAQNFLNALNSI